MLVDQCLCVVGCKAEVSSFTVDDVTKNKLMFRNFVMISRLIRFSSICFKKSRISIELSKFTSKPGEIGASAAFRGLADRHVFSMHVNIGNIINGKCCAVYNQCVLLGPGLDFDRVRNNVLKKLIT